MPVLTGEFICPECGALLRIAQSGTTQVELNCPECEIGLTVSNDHQKTLSVRTTPTSNAVAVSEFFPTADRPAGSFLWWLLTAGLLTVVGLWIFIRPAANDQTIEPGKQPGQTVAKPAAVPDGPQALQPNQKPILPASPDKPEPSAEMSETLSQLPVFAQRLHQLGQKVEQYQKLRGLFPTTYVEPTGLDDHQPLSWLAGLDADLAADRDLLPQWALNWDDPLNDRFVRRRREDLLNPLIQQSASPNRYPASHVVGMAGVGTDAASLAVDHPRAGIFGYSRSTRVDDVKDGLSHTLLAVGITGQLTAWADGAGSVRSLTAEPYINGPDGLGTGQADGMYVLLADGQVRFLNRDLAPVVLRRMAAMADGWPLDPQVAGEPGDQPLMMPGSPANTVPPKSATPEPVPNKSETTKPSTAMVDQPQQKLPTISPVDFEQLLSETVLVYQLLTATPLEQVLVELEALITVPIEFDVTQIPLDDPARKQPVSLNRKNVSYRDLIEDALDSTELIYVLEDQRILIQRKPAPEQ